MQQSRITTAGFAYDAAGHMTQWPGGTVTLGADYDVEGRLSVVKQDGVQRWRYLYDARNRRVRKSNMSGSMPTYEVHGPGGELLGVYGGYWYRSGGQWEYVFRVEEERIYFAGRVAARLDETGSPRWEKLDRLGSVKAWQRYPFGEGNESNWNDEYATYPIDRSTGHYYAWNRFYSATWGRFSSPDPYVMSGGLTNPQGWNRYSYVGNDPVNRYDPRGLQDEIPTYTVNVYAPFPTAALSGAGGDSAEMQEVADLPDVMETVAGWGGNWVANEMFLPEAIRLAVDALRNKKPCRELFGKGADPAQLLEDAAAGRGGPLRGIRFEAIPRSPGEPISDAETRLAPKEYWQEINKEVVSYAYIVINTAGSWNGRWDGSRKLYGNYTDDQFRSMLLLHELGHVFEFVDGLGGFNVKEPDKFDREILSTCFKL